MALQSCTWTGTGVTYSIPRAVGDTGWVGNTGVDGLLVDLAAKAVSLSGTESVSNKTFTSCSLSCSQLTGTLAAGQFPALTGDITTNAGGLTTAAAATQAAITTLSHSSGVAVHGSNTNDSAATGYVGEYVESVVTQTTTNVPANNTWGDFTSISLTAGDWDVTLIMSFELNGATVTVCSSGISQTSGNSATGLVFGSNWAQVLPGNASCDVCAVVPAYRQSLSATTTVYAKVNISYSVATPKVSCRLSARRMR